MLKLIQCEFWKLKRKRFVLLVVLAAFLFPLPVTAVAMTPRIMGRYDTKAEIFDALFSFIMGYGVLLLLPCVIGVLATMLFFMERDNDTFKSLRTIPVTSTQMVLTKIIVLFLMGILFSPRFCAAVWWRRWEVLLTSCWRLLCWESLSQPEPCLWWFLWSFSAGPIFSPSFCVYFTVF